MGRAYAEVSLRLTPLFFLVLLAGACTKAPAPRSSPPTALELYQAGRFTEALALAPPELAASIHYNDDGPSLGDAREALRYRNTPEARLALDPKRVEPDASPLAQLEAHCKTGRCDKAAVLAYRDQHKDGLAPLIRAGRLLLPLDTKAAGECVEHALPLARRIQASPDFNIHGLHWTTATDELYADVLASNRHHGHARGLYVKALTAIRLWPAQSAYTQRRQREIEVKVAALDRLLFAK